MKIFRTPVPIYYLIGLLVICAGIIFTLYRNPRIVVEKVPDSNLQLKVMRSSSYKYTKPFLLMDLFGEDKSFSGLKSSLQGFINQEKSNGKLKNASIYVRKFGGGKWFSVNPDEQYSPGSVMKLMTLLAYLREAETNRGVLDKEILFEKHFSETPVQTIVSKQLIPGKTYTVSELIKEMIIDSDNDATVILNSHINMDVYVKLLKDLELSVPDVKQTDYPLNVYQCSLFFRLLYASTFLSPEMSEYALSLLTESKFNKGLTKSLPPEIKVAHKFGERNTSNEFQLHETGIVYYDDSPYLITVMTKGSDQEELSKVIDNVSSIVYDYMKN